MVNAKYDIKVVTRICTMHDAGFTNVEIVNNINKVDWSELDVKIATKAEMRNWGLTKRKVYEYTKDYILQNRISPTLNEISEEVDRTKSVVSGWIDRLVEEGWLTSIRNYNGIRLPRSLTLPKREGKA